MYDYDPDKDRKSKIAKEARKKMLKKYARGGAIR